MSVLHSLAFGIGTGHDVDPQLQRSMYSSVAIADVRISRNGTPSNSGDASHGKSIFFPHPVAGAADGMGGPGSAQEKSSDRALPQVSPGSVGPCRGGSRPDRTGPQSPAGRGVLRRLREAHDRLENSPTGDAIGALVLFVLLWVSLVAGSILEAV